MAFNIPFWAESLDNARSEIIIKNKIIVHLYKK